MEELETKYDDVKVLAVNAGESLSTVMDYVEAGEYKLTFLMDPEALLSRKYLIGSLPTTYFIDEDGVNLGAYQGLLPLDRAEMFVEAIRENKQ